MNPGEMSVADKIFWGDIHNHNTVGLYDYTKGSLERSIDIAQNNLDFFAFTGHAQWHDMPEMPGGVEAKWRAGFAHHAALWDKTRQMVKEAGIPGKFISYLGYEWHSAAFGDYCLIYPEDGPLIFGDHVRELQAHARRTGALFVPHHLGYKSGIPGRGVNWDYIDETISPIVEIFSEHGGCERDRGPFAYTRHSFGARTTYNTWQYGLARGLHIGVVASTDNHWAHPGACGEGLVAVLAPEFTREAIWEALRHRRCYAVTGERIEVDFTLNGHAMGSIVKESGVRNLHVAVKGWDEIERVEVLKNNRVIHRHFPADHYRAESAGWSRRYRCRVEFGWGPWSAFDLPRIADWEGTVELAGARIISAMPCFQSGPFDENRRSKIRQVTDQKCSWYSYTSRAGCVGDVPNNSVVLDITGSPAATLTLRFAQPAERCVCFTLEHLAATSEIEFTGIFPSESFMLHRLVPDELATAEFSLVDEPGDSGKEDFYYVRVMQENGHAAWSSPIWVAGD